MNYLSFLGYLLASLGVGGAYYQYTSPLFGFYLCVGGLLLSLLLFFPALISFFQGPRHAPWLAILLGLGAGGLLGYGGKLAIENPYQEFTTDVEQPPVFQNISYTIAAQDGAYHHLDSTFQVDKTSPTKTLALAKFPLLTAPAAEIFPQVVKAMENLPEWKVVSKNSFQLEAEAVSLPFRFVDDLVIEARQIEESAETELVVRSRLRFPLGDLGQNKKRITAVLGELKKIQAPAGIQPSIPPPAENTP